MSFEVRRYFKGGGTMAVAFAATVALGLLPGLWDGSIRAGTPQGGATLLLGAAYAFGGTINFKLFRMFTGKPAKVAYLLIEGALLLGIFLLTRVSGQTCLCAYPLVAAVVALLGPVGATVGVALVYLLIMGVDAHFYGTSSLFVWSTNILPAFGFVIIFTRIALREREARARAERLAQEVEHLAVLKERNRLAREIHDSLGHCLTTIHVQLEAARTVHPKDPQRAMEAVERAQALSREALLEVRRSVGSLREAEAIRPLVARLEELAVATDGWGAAVSLEVLGQVRPLTHDAEHALFRTAQEGLTNVRKHARAQKALLTLDYRQTGMVSLHVVDDGVGGAPGPAGHGLSGLRQRISALGGRVSAENQPGSGFHLLAELPA